jgi:hypothetical protein
VPTPNINDLNALFPGLYGPRAGQGSAKPAPPETDPAAADGPPGSDDNAPAPVSGGAAAGPERRRKLIRDTSVLRGGEQPGIEPRGEEAAAQQSMRKAVSEALRQLGGGTERDEAQRPTLLREPVGTRLRPHELARRSAAAAEAAARARPLRASGAARTWAVRVRATAVRADGDLLFFVEAPDVASAISDAIAFVADRMNRDHGSVPWKIRAVDRVHDVIRQ